MISFKDILRIDSKYFQRNDSKFNDRKILELSPITRELLRKKMYSFFSRIPTENLEFITD
jgi:hypothetical protein